MPNTIIIDVLGYTLSDEEITLLKHPEVAGLLLFTRNILNRTQLSQLIQSIRAIRPELILMIDHEGGYVQRIQRHGFTPLPAALNYGEVFDLNPEAGCRYAHQKGYTMAQELLSCGIDLSLAPVLDLHHPDSPIIGQLNRAFHQDPAHVTTLASAFIQGMHDAGMPAVGKHFPGHGSCLGDSHLTVPINNKSIEDLQSTDLKPFTDLIKANLLDGIMPAYVLYPSIDPHHAAGYSAHWLRKLLRDDLHFDGLVISDCLGMKGADIGDLPSRAQQALEAGCDLLIVANQTRHDLFHCLEHLPKNKDSLREARFKTFRSKIQTRSFSPEVFIETPQVEVEGNNRTLSV